MTTTNFSGMGESNALQDAFASETPGPIHDRSREHLGTTEPTSSRPAVSCWPGWRPFRPGVNPFTSFAIRRKTTCRISWSYPR